MATRTRPVEATNQLICDQLVRREVGHCVSTLVDHFAKNPEALTGSDYTEDDLYALLSCDDWESTVTEADGYIAGRETSDGLGVITVDAGDGPEDVHSWREAAEILGEDDPQRSEALEHWIVSDWFARKLSDRGEMTGELFGLTIWGRTCSGQSISQDGVIREIADEMEILAGQKNEWTID